MQEIVVDRNQVEHFQQIKEEVVRHFHSLYFQTKTSSEEAEIILLDHLPKIVSM